MAHGQSQSCHLLFNQSPNLGLTDRRIFVHISSSKDNYVRELCGHTPQQRLQDDGRSYVGLLSIVIHQPRSISMPPNMTIVWFIWTCGRAFDGTDWLYRPMMAAIDWTATSPCSYCSIHPPPLPPSRHSCSFGIESVGFDNPRQRISIFDIVRILVRTLGGRVGESRLGQWKIRGGQRNRSIRGAGPGRAGERTRTGMRRGDGDGEHSPCSGTCA